MTAAMRPSGYRLPPYRLTALPPRWGQLVDRCSQLIIGRCIHFPERNRPVGDPSIGTHHEQVAIRQSCPAGKRTISPGDSRPGIAREQEWKLGVTGPRGEGGIRVGADGDQDHAAAVPEE